MGEYTLSADVDKQRTTVGQPITLTLTISGRGNIKSLPDIPLPALTNFRTFDANAATNIEKKDGEVRGSKVFKTVLIPTASGELTIPAVSFSFFDSTSRAYKTVRSHLLTVHVTPGQGGSAQTTPFASPNFGAATPGGQASAPGIKLLTDDIRYIRAPGSLHSDGIPLYQQGWYRWLHFILLGLLGLGGAARLYYQFFMANTVLYRFRKAHERALSATGKVEDYLAKNDIRGAGGYLANVLQDYLAAKLGIENRSAALRDVVERLRSRGLVGHTGEKLRNIWEMLDLFQFAPAQVQASEVRAAKETVSHVIDEVEKEITWKN